MNNSVLMAEMSWAEYQARIDAGAVCFLPVGSLEQHGYHLCLNVDTLLPTAVCEKIARAVNGVVVPCVQYGYKSQQRSGGGNYYPGTVSLDAGNLVGTIRDILREIIRHGARKIVLVSGHYENNMFMLEGIDLARRDAESRGVNDVRFMMLSYWDFLNDRGVIDTLYPDGLPGWDVEHAGLFETSLMLHLYPHLVDLGKAVQHHPAKFPAYDMFPPHKEWTPTPGTLSSPQGSTAEKGELILKTCVDGIVAVVKKEFGA